MDSLVLFSLIAIFVLAIILWITLNQANTPTQKSAEVKQREIVEAYKMKLRETLLPLHNNPEALKQKKNRLLQEISSELARNIFFDQDEMRLVIQELANYNYEQNS